ncbi:uncharacterized protein F5891DRAFT_1187426 [Suillus fuscotomentosus]|uniref:Uncharacterized protein n=1 Tax=Suillus fuscotomentosus TaxID=1912939 RepID=A0AAD4E8H2_9AGAM|nr:uncharacterized protein F5891DRAFT_1187426 [Suillus fuscotomentosus]KAG1901566.1 hypothetical protein F5891DRAFT_1187426 [Suillus fuscotomentosus]
MYCTSEAVWAAYIKRRPDAGPFRNKGWPHFDEPSPDLDFLNEEGLLQPGHDLDEALLLKQKSDNISTSTSSTLAPASKRHRSSGAAAQFAIADQFSDFTDTFCSSSQPQPSTLAPSPIRRQCVMQRAQNVETHLTADDMAALVEAFQTDFSAADAYMINSR